MSEICLMPECETSLFNSYQKVCKIHFNDYYKKCEGCSEKNIKKEYKLCFDCQNINKVICNNCNNKHVKKPFKTCYECNIILNKDKVKCETCNKKFIKKPFKTCYECNMAKKQKK